VNGTTQQLKSYVSTEAISLMLHTGNRKVSLRVWLEAEAFRAMKGASDGIATIRYEIGGKKGFVQMPVYLARGLFIIGKRACANVISSQYAAKRSKAGK